jgi:hypothetical protein
MKETDNFLDRMLSGVSIEIPDQKGIFIITPNMTAKKYAAINLNVPHSGDAEIDAMIRESRRADLRERIFSGLESGIIWERQCDYERAAKVACGMADTLLAELDKETAQ